MEQSRKKEQDSLRDLPREQVLSNSAEEEAQSVSSRQHLTLAEAERFRTCRISTPEGMAFVRTINAHLMVCAQCRALVQAVSDLGEALDAAEEN